MKSLTKLLALGFCLVALTNCKVEFDDAGNLVIKDVETMTKKISYSDGGWYPAPGKPNFRAHLSLELRNDSKVKLILKRPECEISKLTSNGDFLELADLIDEAELFRDVSNAHIMDAGNEYIETEDIFSDKREIFLKKSDRSPNQLHFKDPMIIREKVNEILAKHPCIADSKNSIAKIQLEVRDGTYYLDRPKGYPDEMPLLSPTLEKSVTVDITGSSQLLSGTEKSSFGITICRRTFKNVKAAVDLEQVAKRIEFKTRAADCVYMANNAHYTQVTITYKNGEVITGGTGCGFNKLIVNHEPFVSGVDLSIKDVNKECAY